MPCDSPTKEEVAALEKSEHELSFVTVSSFSECSLRCLEVQERLPSEEVNVVLGSEEVIGEQLDLILVWFC